MARQRTIAEIEGEVWSFAESQWVAYCKDRASDSPEYLSADECGAKSLGVIDYHPLDWTKGRFAEALADVRGAQKTRREARRKVG